jgi:Cys-rich protein (TIGR01571 family)
MKAFGVLLALTVLSCTDGARMKHIVQLSEHPGQVEEPDPTPAPEEAAEDKWKRPVFPPLVAHWHALQNQTALLKAPWHLSQNRAEPEKVLAPAAAKPERAAVPETQKEAAQASAGWLSQLRAAQAFSNPWLIINFASCAVWASLVLLVAHFYGSEDVRSCNRKGGKAHGKAFGNSSASGGFNDWAFQAWKHPIFDCAGEPRVMMWSLLCPGIRWSDSLSIAGIVSFRTALLTFVLFGCLDWVLMGVGSEIIFRKTMASQRSAAAVVLTVALVWAMSRSGLATWLAIACRRRMRAVFEMEERGNSFARDVLAHLCCGTCAIVQEARHVEAAWRAGHSATVARPGHSVGQ